MDDPRDNDDEPQEDAEEPLSLEALSAAYAQLIDGRPPELTEAKPAEGSETPSQEEVAPPEETVAAEVDPRSILEAMLFVGSPENEPLTSKQAAGLMRGVTTSEIDEMVGTLNSVYEDDQRPYRIESVGAGYSLRLLPQYAALRDKFYGRIREARLSQAAIDILAVVAYRQPLTRDEIDRLRGRPCGAVLNQLVRRQLLRIERPDKKPRHAQYFTTERFLELYGLENLGELPESHEL